MQTQIYWYTLGVVNIHCAWLWLTIMVDYGWLQLCVFVQYTIGYMHGYSLIMVDYGWLWLGMIINFFSCIKPALLTLSL